MPDAYHSGALLVLVQISSLYGMGISIGLDMGRQSLSFLAIFDLFITILQKLPK